ncbi:TetR/AcrR family transcriptional regulator [Novosphingobium malaysiense]|uniref:HTH tetR-type domain-containing protein n=1 Tax=Novosphingobium malaysiense TaxID=1348853 RepID=A0A0B1ZM29_9SPHN|nr:TetR/AcrR family transcriptional regulator [Novosphingobium malaysiense]KHK90248.1 hypothetical protein LK12_16505 [Novosphingobium malaysiense]
MASRAETGKLDEVTLGIDPFTALLVKDEPGGGRSLRRQRRRRAMALAVTRKVLAESPEQFTMRRVAEECGVTVQTLRNGFGRREDLLVAAFNDHTSAVWRALDRTSRGPFLFLDLALVYHRCAAQTPHFLRAMVMCAMASTRPLALAQRHGATIKSAHLRSLAQSGTLRTGVDAQALGAHITRLNTFMMYEWAQGGTAAELRRAMIDGNRLLLMGALTGHAAADVEAWEPACLDG